MISNLWNIWWRQWTWPLKFASIAALIALLVLVIGIFRSCGRREPTLDQQQIRRSQEAIRKGDRREMIEILAESRVREQAIDNSIKLAEEATEKAKRDYSQLSNDELAAELERRTKE